MAELGRDPFRQLQDEAAQAAAAAERRRLRDDIERAGELASWDDTLQLLALGGRPVEVLLDADLRPRLAGFVVRRDHLDGRLEAGQRLLVARSAIRALSTPPDTPAVLAAEDTGDPNRGPTMLEAVDDLRSHRHVVAVTVRAGSARGRVLAVGDDVVVLGAPDGSTSYIPVAALIMIEVLADHG